MMEEPLSQFFIWWDGPDGKEQAVREQESTYRIAQRAFAAGMQAQQQAPYEPSRDALTAPRRSVLADIPFAIPKASTHVSTATIPDARTYNPGELGVELPDPFENVSFTGPQQVAIDHLYPLPAPRATPTVWSGHSHAPETMPMKVVPADLPVRGPVEDVHGEH